MAAYARAGGGAVDPARPAQPRAGVADIGAGVIDLSRLDRPPAGFAACVECAYRDTGSAPICFACANEHTERVSPRSCAVCGQALPEDGRCGNPVCHFEDRYFTRVWAI